MSKRIVAFVVVLFMAAVSACAAPTDVEGRSERSASTSSALGGGPSSVPYPVKSVSGSIQYDPSGHAIPHWTGTIVDIMAADAWAQCGARVGSAAELSTDQYLTYLETKIDQATCPGAIAQTPPPSDFSLVGCGTTVSACPSKVKRWARQRQIASCNVDTSTGLPGVVRFYGNGSMGHTLPSSAFSAFPPSTALTGAIAAAQKEVDIAEVNLCIAQRLRENMASADSLFLGAADLRQLLEVIRERAQIAMTQYALLARVFTNPHDPPGAPAYPTQAFVTLMHWSQQASAEGELRAMGTELGAAVQLHVDATRELGQLLARSASARVDRAGAPTSNPQSDFGPGSWRQRLLALLYGGNPLRAGPTPGEIDPVGIPSNELNAQLEAIEVSVPWETAWTEDVNGIVTLPFPNWLPPMTPAQRYARTPSADPHIGQLLALARKADALYLKELNGDFVHTGPFGGAPGTLTARRIDVDATAPLVWALVEAWLRTEDCKKTNPSCTVGVDDPAMPATDAYVASLLWRKYGVQPSHASTLVSMLADVVPLQSEGGAAKWFAPSEPSVPYEQAGAMHVTGASRTLEAGELAERLPGHEGEPWYRLDPEFNVVPVGNRERAPLYTALTKLFVPRSFDKLNLPRAQGFGQGTAVRRLGAIPALTVVRDLLEDSVAGASASLTLTYLAKVPRALAVIGGAIGEESISIRPSTVVQDLFRDCSELDPLAPMTRPCPTVIQTSSTDGLTAQWKVSVRTEVADPFFDAAVSLVIVPFHGGIETAAALDPTYGSFKGATRAALLESAAAEVALSAPTTLGTSAAQREATVDLPVETALSNPFAGKSAFSLFLKRTQGDQTKYQLLAQMLALETNIVSRAVGDGATSALIGYPVDGQFIAYGGVLGQMGARAWVTRAGDWSKPAYDGFGLPTDWVPPFDPTLAGTGADDASATYLRHARAAADEATTAVQSAIEELLREQADGAALANAQRRAAGIAQLEQRALCGDAKPDCDTSIVDADLSGYFPAAVCSGGALCASAQLTRDQIVPRRLRLAKAVYEKRFAASPPAFDEYAGGKLQGVLVEQWAALRKLQQLVAETAANVNAHQLQIAAAQAEATLAYAQLGQAYAVQAYECSEQRQGNAYNAGFSFPMEWDDGGYKKEGNAQWSVGPLFAQRHECELAKLATNPGPAVAQLASHAAKQAAIVGQAWSWLAAHTTLLLEAGAVLQLSGANIAKSLQDTKLAKAQAQLEATLALDNLQTKFGTYRRYHSYDVWRARGLLESTRRYAVAARRAMEARYVVDLSEMRSDEPFVAAPATWADEIYEYDLAAPASVGLTAIPTSGGGIYPNRLLDYVGNLERFVNGYAVARPTAIAQLDDELFHVPGPDARASGVLSGDVAGWEFRCPNGSWVQHPGLDAATPNAPLATICGGASPARARVSFSLDPWGRLNGHVPDAPYAKRHNARWLQLAVNFVGTGVRNCAIAADPNGCYANAYLRYHLTHAGPAWVTNFDEQWRALSVPIGSIEGAKALTAEQWLDPTGNGFSKPYVASVARTELAGRPIGGTYRLELEVTPDVRLDRLDRVQVLTRSTYWVKQGQSSPPPATSAPPTLTALSHDLADTAGGDSITITGTGLAGAISCTVGGAPATITANTDTSLTVTMPATPAGMRDVHVTTAGGTSNALSIEAWDPSVLTGCTGLLDGPVGRTDDGTGKLLSWTPRYGGYGAAVTPLGGDAAKRPVNGVPLAFDGYDDSLYIENHWTGGATEQSTFFVARTTSANTTALSPFSVPEPVISALYLGSLGFSGSNIAVQPSAYLDVTTFSAAYALNDGQAHLVGWAREHPAADLITTVYADNQTLGSRTDEGATFYNYLIQLGEGYDDGGGPAVTDYFDGQLYAVVSYDRKLTAIERTKLHKWSRVRHGVN